MQDEKPGSCTDAPATSGESDALEAHNKALLALFLEAIAQRKALVPFPDDNISGMIVLRPKIKGSH